MKEILDFPYFLLYSIACESQESSKGLGMEMEINWLTYFVTNSQYDTYSTCFKARFTSVTQRLFLKLHVFKVFTCSTLSTWCSSVFRWSCVAYVLIYKMVYPFHHARRIVIVTTTDVHPCWWIYCHLVCECLPLLQPFLATIHKVKW